MLERIASYVVATTALAAVLIAPVGGAEASSPARPAEPRLIIKPVSGPLHWFDISFGEVEGGVWRKVATISMKVVGCQPGEYLYWADGPAYQDGVEAYGVFGGLGQGEAYCGEDGTSSYAVDYYREPTNLHPGRLTFSATVYHVDNVQVLASGTRQVRIPGRHCSR
ncbi:hypothetical protein [Nocardioides mangrovi]|uniref:Uncharacterized protein n=1 Tax=Nocardioides mangrovi TaxID=2874580 RepID=A0ABS7UHZ0_9ACTN|nr:hypothetical protein [Nocardioides mangrovi]MBZ5740644.1 hypothetical protein [Nocardioides mangrovi]